MYKLGVSNDMLNWEGMHFFQKILEKRITPGRALSIYTGGGVPRQIKKGGLRHGHNPKKGGLRHGHNPRRGVLGTGTSRERRVLGTDTSRKRGVLRTGLVKKTILVTDVDKRGLWKLIY